jgi:hypothetical protein
MIKPVDTDTPSDSAATASGLPEETPDAMGRQKLPGTIIPTRKNFYRYIGPRPDDGPRGDLADMFWDKTGAKVHKWGHYLPIYDRHFGPFRGRPIRMLEIGVSKGGSLDLWRQYFGPDLVLFGIDIDQDSAAYNGRSGQVRIGSQADPAFLTDVVEEMGGIDLVLDDGSHASPHIRASFEVLFPRLGDGGVYLIEDLHATYKGNKFGGYQSSRSYMTDVKQMIDDMHHWYHDEGQKIDAAAGHLAALHIYDSIVVLEKAAVPTPFHVVRGDG